MAAYGPTAIAAIPPAVTCLKSSQSETVLAEMAPANPPLIPISMTLKLCDDQKSSDIFSPQAASPKQYEQGK